MPDLATTLMERLRAIENSIAVKQSQIETAVSELKAAGAPVPSGTSEEVACWVEEALGRARAERDRCQEQLGILTAELEAVLRVLDEE